VSSYRAPRLRPLGVDVGAAFFGFVVLEVARALAGAELLEEVRAGGGRLGERVAAGIEVLLGRELDAGAVGRREAEPAAERDDERGLIAGDL